MTPPKGKRAAFVVLAVVLLAAVACAPPGPVRTTPVPTSGDSSVIEARKVQPERPTVATHAGTVAPGYIEIETGVERDRFDGGAMATQLPTVIKIGVAPRLQLSLFVPASSSASGSFGPGDVAIGMKWRLIEDHPVLRDFAILPTVKFSSGGARGTGTTDVGLLLIDSRVVGRVAIDLNVGVTRRSGDGSSAPRTATSWTVSTGAPIRGRLGWVLECFGYPGTGGVAGTAPSVALLTGPTFTLRPALALDAGIIAPIRGPQPRAAYVGVVANLGSFLHRK